MSLRQFDVCRLGRRLVVVVQHDHLDRLETRLVAPLERVPIREAKVDRMTPIVEAAGERHVVATHLLAAVPARSLSRPLDNLVEARDAIIRAVDLILTGV